MSSTTLLLEFMLVIVALELVAILVVALRIRPRSRSVGPAQAKATARRTIRKLAITMVLTPPIFMLAMLFVSG